MKKNNSKNKYRDSVGASAKELLNFSLDQLISNFVEDKPSISMHANVTARINDLEKTYARLSNAASVLNYWHSSEKYLDAKGEPSSLPQAGRISLASLVTEAIGRNRARSTTLKDLTTLGLLECSQSGFRPKKRSAVYAKRSPIMLAHATNAIGRLIETISHNVSGAPLPRYERQVAATRIAEKELPQFLRFVEQQGQYFIDSIDDWLAGRELSKTSRVASVSVGVGGYAWIEPELKKLRNKKSPKPSTRPRR